MDGDMGSGFVLIFWEPFISFLTLCSDFLFFFSFLLSFYKGDF